MELLIVEKNGWSKPVKIDRAIIRVGSASSNDIQLQSPKIAPVHIQILYSASSASSCKVVNLAHEIAAKVSREVRPLPAYAAVDIRDGDEILFGDYSITFRLPLSADVMQSAAMINATLSFADAVLRPGFATTGVLTVKNSGDQSACQFQVELDGLPEDCFQVDPIPLMYSGAQEEVRIRIFHRILYPPAGLQMIVLKVSAPDSYPGDELIIRQGIYVSPVFKHTLEIVDDLSVAAKLKEQAESARLQQISSAVVIEPQLGTDEPDDSTLIPAVIFESTPLESPISNSLEQQEISAPDLSDFEVVRAPVDANEDLSPIPTVVVAAAVPLEDSISNLPVQQELSARPAQKQAPMAASKPVPDISKLKVMRASVDDDEDSALTPAARAPLNARTPDAVAQQEIPARPAQKQISRPVPDISKLKIMRASVDADEDSALMPAAQQETPLDIPAQKQPAPIPAQPAPDLSKLKVMREQADPDNFWDER